MTYQEQQREKIRWFFENESLWNDRQALKAKTLADGIYSPKLSNIEHCIDCMLQQCRHIKRTSNISQIKTIPRLALVLNELNFDEQIHRREVKDVLITMKHPVQSMDESGYTYWDYAVYKRNQHGRVPQHVLDEINVFFLGGDIKYIR